MDLTAPMEPQAAPGPQESDGGAGSSQGEGGPPAAQVPVRPLEQEPRLAARIMLEDCMALLLDVDDIDRCFAAAAARGGLPVDADGLRTRRALLAAGITSSFNLPPAPQGTTSPQQADGQGSATGDGVFLRVLMLPKGRTMLARALRVLLASPPTPNGTTQHHHQPKAGGLDSSGMPEVAGGAHHPQLLLWALLRNAHNVFGSAGLVAGDTARQIELVDATHRLAAAARDGITKLATPAALLSALQAYVAGLQAHSSSAAGCVASPADALLPYASTRTGSSSSATTSGSGQAPVSTPSSSSAAASLNTAVPPDWLGEVVAALIQRGDQVGMEDAPGKVQQAWSDAVQHVVSSHERHLEALSVIHSAAHSAGNKEALGLVRSLTCRPLAQALMGHVSESQRGRLRELMLGFLT
jgi:DNA topoisomerase 2-associated protein PAT1